MTVLGAKKVTNNNIIKTCIQMYTTNIFFVVKVLHKYYAKN